MAFLPKCLTGTTTGEIDTKPSTCPRRILRHTAVMCRNIKTLYHFEPPATEEEVRASALQYVRKLSGRKSFSQANKQACEHAVDHITEITLQLFTQLESHGPPRPRDIGRAHR